MALADAAVFTPRTRNTAASTQAGSGETQAVAPVFPSKGSLKPLPSASAAATLPGSAQSNIPGASRGRLWGRAAAAITARPVHARSRDGPMGRQRLGGLTR